MARFLCTQDISAELLNLIKGARKRIVLISYSFQLNTSIRERLKSRLKIDSSLEIIFIIGDTLFGETGEVDHAIPEQTDHLLRGKLTTPKK